MALPFNLISEYGTYRLEICFSELCHTLQFKSLSQDADEEAVDMNQIPHERHQQALASLFINAVEEASVKAPHSPAVTLGLVVVKKLHSRTVIPYQITLRAARLLLPLCSIHHNLLEDFIKSA